ncbi:ComEC/Rec2 family competence protein [Streptomyces sp. MUM 203J]|uniref:ComEC/Rec2 family competence protein n=1 Tax=Streptomyces sp. MUM 203J TaxID=2791990 RepID=UPI001F04AA8B|nr:ComEC/Rec2 family competence protein [Streptomyces sp. MUM 203J]MCH0541950.1 ComEC/Rec2 family competence protein [Streptomyces sp. MUM 203J]
MAGTETVRGTVRAASGGRRGVAGARREGPVDLRLVGPALAAWAAAALTLGAPGGGTALAVGLCGVVAGVLLLRPRRRGRWRGTAVAAAGVLLGAAAGAASAGLHGADLRRGPVPGLAEEHARVVADVTVTSDPRRSAPRVHGNRTADASVLTNAEVTEVTAPDGAVTRVRTPVLLITRLPSGERGGSGGWEPNAEARRTADTDEEVTSAWMRLLPSTGLRLSGRLAPPRRPGDPYGAALYVDGGPPRITTPPNAVQRAAGSLREGLRTATDGLPPDPRALLPGLVVGDTTRMTQDLRAAFETTDLTHLTAVSGSNLSIVLILLIGPAGMALHAERRGMAPRLGLSLRVTAVAGGALTLAFVLVCRPDPSVLRAAACGLVTLLAIGTGRRRSLIPALAAAVLLLVLYEPWLARSYGFLLSVLATGALLAIAPRWSAALRARRVPARVAEALAAAAAAQAVCAPVVAVFAARVSLVAVPCNLFAEFAVAPATVLGFVTLALAPVAMQAARLVAECAAWPTGWVAAVARTGAALPGARVDWPDGWWGGLLLAAVTVVLLAAGRRLAGRPWVLLGCAVLLLVAVVRPVPLTRLVVGWPPPGWVFALCDVGQGDAMALAAGEGAAVVVDAGPDPESADRCLRELGVHRVPMVLLTHFHADHVAGLPGVLRGRDVGVVQTTGLLAPPGRVAFVHRTAAAVEVPVVRAVPGERRRAGTLDWEVLWPPDPAGTTDSGALVTAPDEPNDASVTLLVRTRSGVSLLLLGDLEPPAQRGLTRAHPDLPPVDVLKVAHHGSAHQDPGLLHRVRPRLAVVSAGRDNPYGHPSPRTLAALEDSGAAVLRTDRDGAIAVTGAGPDLRAVTRRRRLRRAAGAGPRSAAGGRRRPGPHRTGTAWSP